MSYPYYNTFSERIQKQKEQERMDYYRFYDLLPQDAKSQIKTFLIAKQIREKYARQSFSNYGKKIVDNNKYY